MKSFSTRFVFPFLQEQFIDVTLSCGEHNFPAHKLVLSVCSPYFRHLFLRNPCKHPIVVLKDVHFKYMKLLLMYMYRGEVSCPQEDLLGLLKTARSLQVSIVQGGPLHVLFLLFRSRMPIADRGLDVGSIHHV